MPDLAPLHGGPDALGVPRHDFSTNANACGPCPQALAALAQADRRHYPDPAYTALSAQLAAFHGVAAGRVVIAASASEFIHRISMFAARSGLRHAVLPAHGYGDYARAASSWGLAVVEAASAPALHWACEPASPLGTADAALAAWAQILTHSPSVGGRGPGAPASCRHFNASIAGPHPIPPPERGGEIPPFGKGPDASKRGVHTQLRLVAHEAPDGLRVLDCAYAPLRLDGLATALPAGVWQLWSPNKALGLTGVRAAYAIAPAAALADGSVAALQALAPSWPVGADGVALLTAWVQADTQAWLAGTLATLRDWKAAQLRLCADMGWAVLPGSLANFFTARPPVQDLPALLQALRAQGIKLRDCASFGLPGHVRLGVLAPEAQQALALSWRQFAP